MPIIGAAGITAGAGLIGAGLNAHSASQASNAQSAANAQALQFEREQAAEDKRRYEEAQALQQAHYEAQQAQHEPFLQGGYSVLSAYGIPTPPAGGPQTLRDVATMGTGDQAGHPRRVAQGPTPTYGSDGRPAYTPGITLRDLPNWSEKAWGRA